MKPSETINPNKLSNQDKLDYAHKTWFEQKISRHSLARFIYGGVNPNRIVSDAIRTNALAYAVETDNVRLASLLIYHNILANTNALTWFAQVTDTFFGQPSTYMLTTIGLKQGSLDSLFLKIRSLEMAELLVKRIGLKHRFSENRTVAHLTAQSNLVDSTLLKYYLDEEEKLVDTPDENKNTPLHLLASYCDYHWYLDGGKENSDAKVRVIAQRTKKINALNAEGQTALDIALINGSHCDSFIEIVKAYGGQSTENDQ